jgi:hypothetical protein
METDLRNRLRAYRTAAGAQVAADTALYTAALHASHAASVAASANIICSHTRELRVDGDPDNSAEWPRLSLPPGNDSVANLVLGADGIPAIKSQHG